MLASARYPEQFDGIVAGAPAMRTGNSNIGLAWANAAFSQIAPKDASGRPEPAKTFSAEDRKLITEAILDSCDAKDGLKDGLILDGKACQFDPGVLTCNGAKAESCLAPQKVDALKKAFAGPKNSRGTQVYPAFPWDSGVAAEGVSIPGILTTGARSPVGPPVWESIDVDQLEDRVNASGLDRLTNTAYWTNLSSYFGRGGKLLFYHGVSDPWFSALDTVNYYERMAADSGGMELVREKSSRLYLVPGMGHCSSGAALDRFDLLTAVVNWVEEGKAAEQVVATGSAFPGRSRPLCAHPQHAQYRGQGDPESAASFECK
jgi:feruloyl esterase